MSSAGPERRLKSLNLVQEKSWLTSFSQRAKAYFRTNWGSPFVVGFMVLLLIAALELSIGATGEANDTAVYAFYSLVLGVVLQAVSYARYGEAEPARPSQARSVAPPSGLPRRTKLAVLVVIVVVLVGGLAVGYPALFPGGRILGPGSSNSGCAGNGNDGSIYLGTNAAVSVEICGRAHNVVAGTGGGLVYEYNSGTTTFVAPVSVNGSRFEFWYAIVGSAPPSRVTNTTLVLDLPPGLSSQSSLVELFYTSPPTTSSTQHASNSTATSATSTSSSSTLSTSSKSSSSSTASSSSSTSSSSSSNSTTTTSTSMTTSAKGCIGTDGSVFISTNVDEPLLFTVCGEQVAVTGAPGGGLNYGYRSGYITLSAPASTLSGKHFEFWAVALPSGTEQIGSTQATIYLPSGYEASGAVIVAYYG